MMNISENYGRVILGANAPGYTRRIRPQNRLIPEFSDWTHWWVDRRPIFPNHNLLVNPIVVKILQTESP